MALIWSDRLAVGVDTMDGDHRTLLDLLPRLAAAADARFAPLFGEMVRHLEAHFGREDLLMRQHGFFAYGCHHEEHESVLRLLRALEAEALAGRLEPARQFIASGVEPWFLTHRNTMDWVTAQFLLAAEGVHPTAA